MAWEFSSMVLLPRLLVTLLFAVWATTGGVVFKAVAKRARVNRLSATFWPVLKLTIGRELSIVVILTPLAQYLTSDPVK